MSDRTVHARLEDAREIVRYDRAGKWYWEGYAHRMQISVREAARLASLSGSQVFLGRSGGGAFERLYEKARRS